MGVEIDWERSHVKKGTLAFEDVRIVNVFDPDCQKEFLEIKKGKRVNPLLANSPPSRTPSDFINDGGEVKESPLNDQINPHRKVGRPSLAIRVSEVYQAMRDAKSLSPHSPKTSIYAAVRVEIKARFPNEIDAIDPDKGLKDDAMARAISKLIDEDKQSGRYLADKL